MTAFYIITLIFLASTVALWTILSHRYKKTLTKPYEFLVLKTDKWAPRINYAASIAWLISSFMQLILVAIRLAQTLMN